MKVLFSIIVFLAIFSRQNFGQHYYNDSFTAQKAESYIIDGVGVETFWDSCEWYNLEYIWIPFGEAMAEGDFTGRVKFAWTSEKLLVLAEIEDDVLSDTHADPLSNYWNDDCFEVFIDEDYSGGDHTNNYNAFAYHCAINETDVVDIGDGSTVNLKDNVEFDLDTIDATHYVWELAITIYDDSFNESNSNNTTVPLTENKEMGIAVAYCDNDGGSERENFIGLINVDAQHYNSAWQDASVFGKLTLEGTNTGGSGIINTLSDEISIFQDKGQNLIIDSKSNNYGNTCVTVYDMNGRVVVESSVYLDGRILLDINNIRLGAYIIKLRGEAINSTCMFYKYR